MDSLSKAIIRLLGTAMLVLEQVTWLGKTLVLVKQMHLVNPQTLVLGVTAMHLEAKTRARQVLERVQVDLEIQVVLDRQQTMHLEAITQLATMVSVVTTTHLLLERILQVLDRRQILVLETPK